MKRARTRKPPKRHRTRAPHNGLQRTRRSKGSTNIKATRTRTHKLPHGAIRIPPYRVGSIIGKEGVACKLIIIDDHKPLTEEPHFTLVSAETWERVPQYWTPKAIAIYGYEIEGEKTFDQVCHIKDSIFKVKREDKLYPDKCNLGKYIPLEDAVIIRGKNPLKRGVKVRIHRSWVNGLRARCPVCGRVLPVKLLKGKKEYVLKRHKAKKAKWDKKRRRTK